MAEVDTKSEVIESKVNESENEDGEESKENEDGAKSMDSTPKPKRTPLKTMPLYDSPLTQSGKRVRTQTPQYVVEKKEEFVYEFKGTGVALGEIEYIEFMITKEMADNMKKLHSVCFGRPGDRNNVKKNLRQFNGLDFDKTDKKYEVKKTRMDGLTMAELKNICKILGLEVAGAKSDVVVRILDFVLKPEDKGKSIPKKKKKKSKSGKKKRSDAGKKKGPRKSKGGDTENESATNDENDSSANDENDSTADTADSSDSGSESETEEKPKKTPAKKPATKTPAKKTPAKKTIAKKTPAKKTPAKKTPAKKSPVKRSKSEVDSDSDSSDDEPLIKKTKSPPSNDEIKQKVEELLKDADLEEVTMKSVCKQIYEMYPGFDLTDRKSFIKETVKSIISWCSPAFCYKIGVNCFVKLTLKMSDVKVIWSIGLMCLKFHIFYFRFFLYLQNTRNALGINIFIHL